MARNREVIQEYLIKDDAANTQHVRLYLLAQCQVKGLTGYYCEICRYLTHNQGMTPICIRYKTKNTPKHPLVAKPSGCEHFLLDKKLYNNLLWSCQGIKIIDLSRG